MLMGQWRFTVVLGLLVVWLAMPALACLPNLKMTDAEMACCKKMAGDCHMGANHHPCCERASNISTPVATVQPVPQVHPDFTLLAVTAISEANSTSEIAPAHVRLDIPPPEIPAIASISILKI